MPGQSNITKFFRPTPTKPKASVIAASPTKSETSDASSGDKPGNLENTTPNKQTMKRKPSEEAFSPDQKKRMVESQLKSKIVLWNKRTPALSTNIGSTWFAALENEFKKPYFAELSSFVAGQRASATVFPPHDQVWSWTHHFPIEETKVVILGQDPYHGPNQAHGLCFSVQKGVRTPPSLVNMFKELSTDIPGFQTPSHGDLTGWARQGVLLLNACLTVRQANANSHSGKGWEQITDAVVRHISTHCRGVVFLLWGAHAQKKAAVVDGKKHHLLKSVHPSPLSAHRGFLGCKHFSKCNELLEKEGKTPIDWTKL